MAEKDYAASKLINLHSADGTTLLIPKIPLSTVDNNAYTVVVDKETSATSIVTKGAGSSLQAAVQAEIAAAVADSVVGNYVPWTDGSNVVIPGMLTVEGDTTLKDAVRVEGKLVATQDMYIETTADGSTTSTKVATMADIDGITGGTLNNYYTKGEVDAIAEGASSYTDAEVAKASAYTDSQIASALTGLPDGSSLIPYIDAQDDAHQAAAEATAKAYTDKQDSALREELLDAIGSSIDAIDHLKREIVQDELPAIETADPTTIYMVPSVIGEGEAARTVYVEYMVINDKWETIGDSDVQLVNYYTKEETDDAIADALDSLKVDGKDLKSYIDAQDAATSTAAVTAANGYTDDALANYVPWTSDCDIVVSRSLIVNEDAYMASLHVGDSSTSGIADIYAQVNISGQLTLDGYAQFHNNLDVGYGALIVNTSVGYGSSTVTMGSVFEADLYNSTVKVYDEWQVPSGDGSTTVTSSGLAAVATEHDIAEALANYLDSTAASQAFIRRDEIATPYSHIVYTSQFGSHTFDLEHGSGGNSVTVYTSEGVDAKFAPIDGATLTNVSSITGENAEVVVSKVTATELQIVNEVQLAGIILGKDQEGQPVTHITETMANFQNVAVTSGLTVSRDLVVEGMLNIQPEGGQIEIGMDQTSTGMITIGDNAAIAIDNEAGLIDFGAGIANIDLNESKVQVYDEWEELSEDGSSTVTSTGLANVATEHDIAATSSSIMQVINALPGVGEGAILYDVLEDEQI